MTTADPDPVVADPKMGPAVDDSMASFVGASAGSLCDQILDDPHRRQHIAGAITAVAIVVTVFAVVDKARPAVIVVGLFGAVSGQYRLA